VDLIVFMYGGNDMQRGYVDLKESMQPYYDEYGEAIDKYRAGKPGLPCLIMSLIDHGERGPGGEIRSRKYGAVLAQAQRKVAKDKGCGFFDTYHAGGGEGTAARWFRARPRLLSPDLGHPSTFGHELIANMLTDALLYGYQEFREKMAGEPFLELKEARDD
jgi:lysophospholipase L1-like esterase